MATESKTATKTVKDASKGQNNKPAASNGSVSKSGDAVPNETKIDIKLQTRQAVCKILNARLADCIDLTFQSKQAHWNVKGPHFIGLHKLFDEIFGIYQELTDEIAERIMSLGGNADGLIQDVAKRTTLPVYQTKSHTCAAHVEAFSTALATFGKVIREDIDKVDDLGDAGTADLLTDVSRATDKYLWFVEAHQQEET